MRADGATHGSARLEAFRELVTAFGRHDAPPERYFDAVTRALVDALLARDHETLEEAESAFRSVQAMWARRADSGAAERLGRVRALVSFAFAGAERLPATRVRRKIAPGSRAHEMLSVLAPRRGLATRAIVERTGLDGTAVSRVGRGLLQDGLATRTKVGKVVLWDITPLGVEALRLADSSGVRRRRRRTDNDAFEPVLLGASGGALAAGSPAMTGGVPAIDGSLLPGANLVEATNWRPLQFDAHSFAAAWKEAPGWEVRSRLRMLDVLCRRPQEVATRMFSCETFRAFAKDEHIQLAVPPLHADAKAWQRVVANVFHEVSLEPREIRDFWPVTVPRCDAFAIVRGDEGRQGVVLIEAKSRPEEFLLGKPRVQRRDRREQVQQALRITADSIGATRKWDLLSRFHDPANRLALLYFLKERGVPAWLMNVYFVCSQAGTSTALLSSALDWTPRIDEVRETLAITAGHSLTPWVTQEFIDVPAEPTDAEELRT